MRLMLLLTLTFFFPWSNATGATPTAEIVGGKIVVTGHDTEPKQVKNLQPNDKPADLAERPAVLGEWQAGKTPGTWQFTPNFPFNPGRSYRIELAPGQYVTASVPVPPKERAAQVKAIYPSSEELPENVLRFYIEFTKPMSRGDVYQHIKLYRLQAPKVASEIVLKAVDQPFLELAEELWNKDQTRLTLYIDPGRIKNGVKPRLDLGPVFEAGERYQLVISGKMKDGNGNAIAKEKVHHLRIGKPIATAPDPKQWQVVAPKAGAQELTITFDRSMNWLQLPKAIELIDAKGQPVPTTMTITPGEKSVTMKTKSGFVPGQYQLKIDSELEDTSGNAINHPFEVPQGQAKKDQPQKLTLTFEVK